MITVLLFSQGFSQKSEKLDFDSSKQYTQQYIDSLIKNRVPLELSGFKKMFESNSELYGWPYYYQEIATNLSNEKKYDSILHYVNKGIEIFENSKVKRKIDEKIVMNLYYKKAVELRYLGDHSASITNFQRSLGLSQLYTFEKRPFIYTGLAANYYKVGNDSLSLKYYVLATKDSVYMNLGNRRTAISTLARIGRVYERLKDLDSAFSYYKKALKISGITDYKLEISGLNAAIGNIYFKNDKLDSTYHFYKKSVSANAKFGASYNKIHLDYFLSFIDVYEGRYKKPEAFLNNLVKEGKSFEKIDEDEKYLVLQSYKLLGMIYEKDGNSKKYQSLLSGSLNFIESVHEMQLKEDLVNLEVQYQTKEKDASIAQLEEK